MLLTTETLLDKTEVMESFKSLPQMVSSKDLIERIIVLHKINEALKEVENGQVHTHQSVMNEAKEWLQK